MTSFVGYASPRPRAFSVVDRMALRMRSRSGSANYYFCGTDEGDRQNAVVCMASTPSVFSQNNSPLPTPGGFINPSTHDITLLDGHLTNLSYVYSLLRASGVCIGDGSSNVEVASLALSTWGTDALELFAGAFAIAHYSARNRQLLLARDVFGLKPLYATRVDEGIAFGSRVADVLESGIVTGELDPEGVASLLAYGTCTEPLTLHRDVTAVPAGSFLLLAPPYTNKTLRTGTYAPNSLLSRMESGATSIALSSILPPNLRMRREPLGVLVTADPESVRYASELRALGHDVCGLVITYEDQNGQHASVDAKLLAESVDITVSTITLDSEWIVAQWKELHRDTDSPSANGLCLGLAAQHAAELGLAAVLTTFGRGFATDLPGKDSRLTTNHILAALYRSIPRRCRHAILRGMGITSWQRRLAIDAEYGSVPEALRLASSRRVMSDSELTLLGCPNVAVFGSKGFLATGYGSEQALFAAPRMSRIAGPSRDPCIAAMVRDASHLSAQCGIEIIFPWLHDPLNNCPAERPHVGERFSCATLDAEDRALLPLGSWTSGSLASECIAAIDELASCPLLSTGGVRSLWARLGTDPSRFPAIMTMVALGLYLEGLKLRQF